MLTRLIIIVMFLHMAAVSSGQISFRRSLTRRQINNLLQSLHSKLEDTTRIDILLRLADFHLQKVEGDPALDSAAAFMSQAKEIQQRTSKRDGVIWLYESTLLRKSGKTDAAKKLVNKSIVQLQKSNDEYHLAMAYLELTRDFDLKEPDQETAMKNVFVTLFQRAPRLIPREQLDTCMLELLSFYNVQLLTDSYAIKLDYLNHLLRSYQTLGRKVDEFWTRKEMADLHYQQGKIDMAIRELLEIGKEQKAGNYPGVCYTYDLLSGLYNAGGNLDKALYYSLETIKNVHTTLDSLNLPNFYLRIAGNYSQTGSTSEAIRWNLKTLNYLIAVKKTGYIYNIIRYITLDLIKSGRPREALALILDKSKNYAPSGTSERVIMLLTLAQCYATVHEDAMAEKYCQELISLTELRIKRKEIVSDFGVYQFLAYHYLDIGQYAKAEKYFTKSMEEQPQSGDLTIEKSKSSFFFQLDSARGNYLSAIKHLQSLQRENDSIFTAKKAKQIEELKIAYETEQKDQLINLKEQNIQLLTKQDQLQKSKLQQGAILRNISFAVVSLLIIIVVLFYNRYRLKQRTNRKLELQQLEIAKQNISLQHLVNEKDWLVKEIHHRVKNNLQIVMSLLNSQSAFIDNDAALTAIHDSQHRVHAMSLIHQKLYSSENLSSIDMRVYIRELVSYLADSFIIGQRIRFELAIDPLEMDVSQAVPLGLILNEAITNSIKYAFPNERDGIISISVAITATNHYMLTISDNGVGIPTRVFDKKRSSLGMSLMEGLSKELGGSFSIENNNGTRISISFVHEASVGRPDTLVA